MNLINKINRLNKIPQLLNKKREAEDESEKKKKDNNKKGTGFSFEHDDAFIKKRPDEPVQKPIVSTEKGKTVREGVGRNIDVIV